MNPGNVNPCADIPLAAQLTPHYEELRNIDVDLPKLSPASFKNYPEVISPPLTDKAPKMFSVMLKHSSGEIPLPGEAKLYVIPSITGSGTFASIRKGLQKRTIVPKWTKVEDLRPGDLVAHHIPRGVKSIPIYNFSVDDARFYGLVVSHATLSKDIWSLASMDSLSSRLWFVRKYLKDKGIGYNETDDHKISWKFTNSEESPPPFVPEDVYASNGHKRISDRMSYLPLEHTKSLLKGMLDLYGSNCDNRHMLFSHSDTVLAEDLRYQCLRLGVPTSSSVDRKEVVRVLIPNDEAITGTHYHKLLTNKHWVKFSGNLFIKVTSVG